MRTIPIISAFILLNSSAYALTYLKECSATIKVKLSCEATRGYSNCSNFYEGEGCNASQCLRGYNGFCRSIQPPVRVYCKEAKYEKRCLVYDTENKNPKNKEPENKVLR